MDGDRELTRDWDKGASTSSCAQWYALPMRALAAALLMLAVWLSPASGNAACVNEGGTGGCFATIQEAVDAASDFETIEIAAGMYPESVTISQRRGLTLQGAGADQTLLDPGEILLVHCDATTIADLAVENSPEAGVETKRLAGLPRKARARTTIERVRLRGHYRAGVRASYGEIVLRDSTVVQNQIHGIHVGGDPASGNRYYTAYLTVIGSAIADNGNGISAYQSNVTVNHSTISESGGLAIWSVGPSVPLSPTVRILRSTILGTVGANRGSTLGSILDVVDFSTTFRSRGFNVIGEILEPADAAVRATDQVGVDPMLAPLADNGGVTPTHALLPGSPAIAAVGSLGICRAHPDQRGVPRTAPCDVGAFEAP
jgi:hypothetical protein